MITLLNERLMQAKIKYEITVVVCLLNLVMSSNAIIREREWVCSLPSNITRTSLLIHYLDRGWPMS